MFKDEHRYDVWNKIRQHDVRAFSKQLTPGILAEAAKRSSAQHLRAIGLLDAQRQPRAMAQSGIAQVDRSAGRGIPGARL
jgi:hypothetical protein